MAGRYRSAQTTEKGRILDEFVAATGYHRKYALSLLYRPPVKPSAVKKRVRFTRCRPYHKNDQCHVEQKNGTVAREYVGYDRYEGQAARNAQLLAQGLPAVPAIPTLPGHARWDAALREAGRLLEMASHEMRAYYEDRLVAWQESDRGEAFQERLEALESLRSDLSEQLPS